MTFLWKAIYRIRLYDMLLLWVKSSTSADAITHSLFPIRSLVNIFYLWQELSDISLIAALRHAAFKPFMCFREKNRDDFEMEANNLYQKAPTASRLISLAAKQQWNLESKLCNPTQRQRNEMSGGYPFKGALINKRACLDPNFSSQWVVLNDLWYLSPLPFDLKG